MFFMPSSRTFETPIQKAYAAEQFRKEAHQLVDVLADYLARAISEEKTDMFSNQTPDALKKYFQADFTQPTKETISKLVIDVLQNATWYHHPHFLGHQVSTPLPAAALAEFTAALLNNTNCVYEMGPVACAMEKHVIDWMAQKIGYDTLADGFLTSGGTLGNLTALLAARQQKAGFNVWKEGVCSSKRLSVLVSEQSHYSVKRALNIMGLGDESCVQVLVKENFSMDTTQLEKAYQTAIKENRKVFAVVANACSTATGSYDDLEAIAYFCEKHGLWMHVDGAHGATALLSKTHKKLLKGIETADSVVWDAHKMMMMPTLITAVIFKNGRHAHETFRQSASYILDRERNWFDYAQKTMECTKPFMAFKLYASLWKLGEDFFGTYVDQMVQLTQKFATFLEESDDFEIAVFPESNILCFRYRGVSKADNALQEQIRNELLASKQFYIVKTELKGTLYLRCTIINPQTEFQHLMTLVEQIRRIAANITKNKKETPV